MRSNLIKMQISPAYDTNILYTLRYYMGIGLATIEVCIFCAVTLVAALFCLKNIIVGEKITMKHLFKSVIAIFLCIMIVFTMLLTSCNNTDTDSEKNKNKEEQTQAEDASKKESDDKESSDNNGSENSNGNNGESTDKGNSEGGSSGNESITVLPTVITLDKSDLSMVKGDNVTLTVLFSPSNVTDKTITWTTSDASVATVNNGTVSAVGEGTATIKAFTSNGITAECNVNVEKYYSQGMKYLLSADETYYILSGRDACEDTKIVIPDMYKGLPVKKIGEKAFYKDKNIVSVIMNNNITEIGVSAFSSCTYMQAVTLSPSLKNISDYAFYYCSALENIIFPDTLEKIALGAFEGCSKLKSVIIPDGVKDINARVFIDCTGLADVVLHKDVNTIYSNAFARCRVVKATIPAEFLSNFSSSYLEEVVFIGGTQIRSYAMSGGANLKKVTMCDTITTIQDAAFKNCTSLTDITFSRNLTTIGDSAFCGCSTLENVILPDSLTTIGTSAFANCTSLTDIMFSRSLTTIGNSAFYGCSTLENVILPNSLMTIEPGAFANCTQITDIIVPDSVTSIGWGVLLGCNNLVSLKIPFVGNTKDGTTNTHFGYIFAAEDSSAQGEAIPSSLKNVTVTGGKIAMNSFSGCNGLESVTIGNSVTSIYHGAFENCTNLTSVTIGSGVTSIDSVVFLYCYKLVEVINKSSLTLTEGSYSNGYVAYYALEVHDGESKIVNKNGYLFYTVGGVNYLVNYIGKDTELTLPANYNGANYVINDHAFYNNDKITKVTIPDSVTSIGSSAFSYCSSLTRVTIGSGVTSIGYYAFAYCDSLTSVTIGNSVTSLGEYAFAYCGSLTSVTIGNGVKSIGSYAFFNCTGLDSIRYRGTSVQWSEISKGSNWNKYHTNAYITISYTMTYNYTGE